MSKKNNYFLLHGFLGNRRTFSKLIEQLELEPETNQIYCPELLSGNTDGSLSPENDFVTWANNFNSYVKSQGEANNILVGYSMGGRLGVHAFMAEPSLWDSCYFVSSNPGLIKNSEKIARMAWEDGWCYQIDNKPWDEFIELWNNQDIFKHSEDINPLEENYDKQSLKLALKNWSLTKHSIDLEKINNKKLHWLVGSKDTKYKNIFKTLESAYKCRQVNIIDGYGHRINIGVENLNYSNPGLELI